MSRKEVVMQNDGNTADALLERYQQLSEFERWRFDDLYRGLPKKTGRRRWRDMQGVFLEGHMRDALRQMIIAHVLVLWERFKELPPQERGEAYGELGIPYRGTHGSASPMELAAASVLKVLTNKVKFQDDKDFPDLHYIRHLMDEMNETLSIDQLLRYVNNPLYKSGASDYAAHLLELTPDETEWLRNADREAYEQHTERSRNDGGDQA